MIRFRSLALILTFAVLLTTACMPTLSIQTATAVNTDLASRLQSVLDRALRQTDNPGATVAVMLPDHSMWVGASGMADLERRTPMQPDSMFRIASVTKTFVATLVMQLAEDGILNLEDTLTDWLPNSLLSNIQFADRITIRQLLNHTSGIYDYLESDAFFDAIDRNPTRVWDDEDVLNFVDGDPYFNPGASGQWEYSNTNYILLGLIIEAATGRSLADELRSRIYQPLGMNNTYLETKEPFPGNLVRGYESAGRRVEDVTDINTGNGLADGGILSTAADLARFADGLFRGGLVSDATLQQMLNFHPVGEYGLGIANEFTSFGNTYGHTGSILGYISIMWYFPDEDLIVTALVNLDFGDADSLVEAVLDAL